MSPTQPRGRRRGVLAPASRLDRWVGLVLVVLLVASSARYVQRHPLDGSTPVVLGAAAVLGASWFLRGRWTRRSWWPSARVAVVLTAWTVLVLLAPSFAWTAVPVAVAVLQVLPFRAAVAVVAVLTVVVTVAWSRISGPGVDPTLIVGPPSLALLTVLAVRALDREAEARQEALDRLVATREELAAAEHRAGALGERARLSREIHDAVGQGLLSITLLLEAADEGWERAPSTAREHVRRATGTARESLDEVRRVVRDLAPGALEAGSGAGVLPDAVERLAAGAAPGLEVSVHVHGTPRSVPPETAAAVLNTARGALGNVVEHARASSVAVTLTYLPDTLRLDVRDDGTGMAGPPRGRGGGARGYGITGLAQRAASLGGEVAVESELGEGTTVTLSLPVPLGTGQQ